MKICVIAQVENWRGGIQQYSQNYAEALFQKTETCAVGYRSYFPLWLYPGDKNKIREQHRTWKEPVPVYNILKYYSLLSVWKAFRMIHKELKADVVDIQWCSIFHAPIFIPLIMLFKYFSKISVFITVHNVLPHENRFIDKALCKITYGLAHRLVVHSQRMKQDLIDIFSIPPEKVTIIPHGICFEDKGALSQEEARRVLKIKEEKVFLFFGLVRKYKGLDLLLDAFAKIKDDFNAALVIAGDFVEGKEKYERMIRELNIADRTYIHSRYIEDSEVPIFFAAADILVQPYRNFSGQSGIPPTAYHHARPVIAADVGGLSEIVIHEKTGLVVPAENRERLAEALRFFLENPEKIEAYGANGKKFLETELSWNSIAEKMCGVYAKEIKGTPIRKTTRLEAK